jgi:hypothetical protein
VERTQGGRTRLVGSQLRAAAARGRAPGLPHDARAVADCPMLRLLLKTAVAVGIVVSTYYAILGIAEYKADALAGGGAFVLDRRHAAESGELDALCGRLQRWGEPDLAASLASLRDSGHLWVAPRLARGRSAIYVNSLGLVSRIYLREDDLVVRDLPFPDLDVPEAARLTFARICLAGTLYHELQHFQGVEDERVAYEREIGWYRALGERAVGTLSGDEGRFFEWAVDSALQSAAAARQKATGEAP